MQTTIHSKNQFLINFMGFVYYFTSSLHIFCQNNTNCLLKKYPTFHFLLIEIPDTAFKFYHTFLIKRIIKIIVNFSRSLSMTHRLLSYTIVSTYIVWSKNSQFFPIHFIHLVYVLNTRYVVVGRAKCIVGNFTKQYRLDGLAFGLATIAIPFSPAGARLRVA